MIKTHLKLIMLTAIVIYIILLAAIYIWQRKLQYYPFGEIVAPEFYDLEGFATEKLLTASHDKILAWYKKPAADNKKIIVYFHGNAGNMGNRSQKLKIFAEAGYGIMAISYSGYYGSTGSSSEKSLLDDGKAALDFLYQQGFKSQDIILYGESLGSGIAVQLAATTQFFALVLECPYASIADVAQRIYWFVPVKLMLKDRFESIKYLSLITSPVIIFHGTADNIVPYFEGQKVFAALNSTKKFITVEGAGHLKFDNKFLLDQVSQFVKNIS